MCQILYLYLLFIYLFHPSLHKLLVLTYHLAAISMDLPHLKSLLQKRSPLACSCRWFLLLGEQSLRLNLFEALLVLHVRDRLELCVGEALRYASRLVPD